MLINTEITIKVTNNGKENNAEVKTDINKNFKDVLTSIKLAEKIYMDMFYSFCREKGITDEKEALEMYNSLTLEELYKTTE